MSSVETIRGAVTVSAERLARAEGPAAQLTEAIGNTAVAEALTMIKAGLQMLHATDAELTRSAGIAGGLKETAQMVFHTVGSVAVPAEGLSFANRHVRDALRDGADMEKSAYEVIEGVGRMSESLESARTSIAAALGDLDTYQAARQGIHRDHVLPNIDAKRRAALASLESYDSQLG